MDLQYINIEWEERHAVFFPVEYKLTFKHLIKVAGTKFVCLHRVSQKYKLITETALRDCGT